MSSDSDPLLKHPRFKYHWLLKFKLLKHLCLSSKAAILIILLATVIGGANTLFQDIVVVSILGKHYAHMMDIAMLSLVPHVTLTFIMTVIL